MKKVISALDSKAVEKACDSLLRHCVIAIPTDTIYGLLGLADVEQVVDRIYEIKNRDILKTIAICVGRIDELKKWAEVTVSDNVLRSLLPGPFTLIFEKSELHKLKLSNLNPQAPNVGIRIPNHRFINDLCRRLNRPLALTSANISSKMSPCQIEHFSEIWPKIDSIFDGGLLSSEVDLEHLGSTVIDLSEKNAFKIIRSGCAEKKAIEILNGEFSLSQIE